jgi:uncharacterized membrane protein
MVCALFIFAGIGLFFTGAVLVHWFCKMVEGFGQ